MNKETVSQREMDLENELNEAARTLETLYPEQCNEPCENRETWCSDACKEVGCINWKAKCFRNTIRSKP